MSGQHDPARQFFFLHVMKTAGTTFARHLREQFPLGAIYPARGFDWHDPADIDVYSSVPRLLDASPDRRAEIRVYTGHFAFWVHKHIDPTPLTLTLLRDPIDRTVSVLKHFKRRNKPYHDLSLDAIYDNVEIFRFFIENHQAKVFSLTYDDVPRTILRPIEVDEGRFRRAKENLATVDMLGLTERYDEFVDDLRARFGWWPDDVNRRDRANTSFGAGVISDDLRRRIVADNAYDVEFYRYARDLVAQRRRALCRSRVDE